MNTLFLTMKIQKFTVHTFLFEIINPNIFHITFLNATKMGIYSRKMTTYACHFHIGTYARRFSDRLSPEMLEHSVLLLNFETVQLSSAVALIKFVLVSIW